MNYQELQENTKVFSEFFGSQALWFLKWACIESEDQKSGFLVQNVQLSYNSLNRTPPPPVMWEVFF